ncbi:Hsp70 family protein, partial [Candidatus Hepatobacter penaei]|uniref:Hsp70 family protein n=1 Tax=Candidatus Hepatobacter penaei TaxID=1274402 RepID=UPI0004F2E255
MSLQIQEPETENTNPRCTAIGIDLGTTHTLVSVMRENAPALIHLDDQLLMPSLIGWEDNPSDTHKGPALVFGHEAAALLTTRPDHVVSSIKRLMGASPDSSEAHTFPHTVFPHASGGVALKMGDHLLTPTELTAHFLSSLKTKVETALGHPVHEAVITIPAYFRDHARAATRKAAEKAGFRVLRLLSEPTSAALAYGLDQGIEGLYGVYDLGGGTFDFSLLSMSRGVFDVRATGGDTQLGGDDIDEALAQWALGQAWPSLSPAQKMTARLHAKVVKEVLSHQEEAVFLHPPHQHTVTRDNLTHCAQTWVDKTFVCVKNVLRDANVQPHDLKGIILVGGATRMPLVQKAVSSYFGQEALHTLDPDHVVALGAGLQAKALSQGADHILLDVTPLSLGIEVIGDTFEPLIRRNTRIPVKATQTFTTAKDNQDALRIHVLQGEHDHIKHNRSLAMFEFVDLPPLPAGTARICVSFTLDKDGILTVSAQEETTGQKQTVKINPSYGLTLEGAKALLDVS